MGRKDKQPQEKITFEEYVRQKKMVPPEELPQNLDIEIPDTYEESTEE